MPNAAAKRPHQQDNGHDQHDPDEPHTAPHPGTVSRHVYLRRIPQMRALRKRRALPITDTELKLMAAAAIIGESNSPNTG
jgi:hypothetical protein